MLQHSERLPHYCQVYCLNPDGLWDDKGTGHVSVEFMEVRCISYRVLCAAGSTRACVSRVCCVPRPLALTAFLWNCSNPGRSGSSSSRRATAGRCSSTASAARTSTSDRAVRPAFLAAVLPIHLCCRGSFQEHRNLRRQHSLREYPCA
jgi:hypothetical protein